MNKANNWFESPLGVMSHPSLRANKNFHGIFFIPGISYKRSPWAFLNFPKKRDSCYCPESDVWWRSERKGITCLLAHDWFAPLQTCGYLHLCKEKVLGFISDILDHSQGTFADLPWLSQMHTSHNKFHNTERSIKVPTVVQKKSLPLKAISGEYWYFYIATLKNTIHTLNLLHVDKV